MDILYRCKSLGLLLVFVFTNLFSGQAQELPKVIPPSPETAALFKALDYPVDYSTGIPQMNIPLYEVKSGSLTVPISMSYHASGRKVYDQNGPIALGWSLNAGGLISRTVYGSPDFGSSSEGTIPFPYPFKREADINQQQLEGYQYLVGIEHYPKAVQYGQGVHTWVDTEYDIFSYSLNGRSGKFIFKDNNSVKSPALIPVKPYKLEWNNTLSFINIIDDKGVLFKFSAGEAYRQNGAYATSSWILREIISADKADTIFFKYTGFNREHYSISQQRVLVDQWYVGLNGGFDVPPNDPVSENESPRLQDNLYTMQRLIEIRFKQGKVKFNLHTQIPPGSSLDNDMIKNIQILNRKDEVIKTIDFEQTHLNHFYDGFHSVNKLDNIQFRDKNGASIDKYAFDYYPVKYPSPNGSYINVRQCDWWGYYTGIDNNGRMVPQTITDMTIGGSNSTTTTQAFGLPIDREPNLAGTQSGVLKKITYPTGGSTEFTYGLNKYKEGSVTKGAGGLRIEEIRNQDGQGNTYYKTYQYENGFNGQDHGYIELIPGPNTMAYEFKYVYIDPIRHGSNELNPMKGGTYRERVYTSGFLPALHYLAEKPIYYPKVTEFNGTRAENAGKTIYYYDYSPQSPHGLSFISGLSMGRYHVYDFNHWKYNTLRAKEEYARAAINEPEPYRIRKRTSNQYQDFEAEKVLGFHVQRTHIFPQEGHIGVYNRYPDLYAAVYNPFEPLTYIYAYSSYQISVGVRNLNSTSETVFTDNDQEFTNTVTYHYNSNQLLARVEKQDSNHEILKTETKYPFDFPSVPIYQAMINKNMLDYPVEQNELKNATPLKSVQTTYKDWGNNVIAPELISERQGTSPYEVRARYKAYDIIGNILTVSEENDHPISYLYGYNNTLPVAEVKNARNELRYAIGSFTKTSTIIYNGEETQQKAVSFYLAEAGTVNINVYFGGDPGSETATGHFNYTLQGPAYRQGEVCVGNNCAFGSRTVSLPDLPAGNYTFSTYGISNSAASHAFIYIGCSYTDKQLVTSGIAEFYYQGFEDDQHASEARGHTGRKCNNGRNFIVGFARPNAKAYKISWHQWDGSKWVYMEEAYTGSKSFDAALFIDDIRVNPMDAQMTTYTYEPLVGITSSTDANSRSTYFVYDAYNRLSLVKDEHGNILKTYCYYYAGQLIPCDKAYSQNKAKD